jgi:hypothetical protein
LHPLFWSKEKKLRFFCDASDEIKFCNDVNILAEVENININVPWDSKLTSILAISLKNDKRYNFQLVRDLLRAIINKTAYYRDPQSKRLKVIL